MIEETKEELTSLFTYLWDFIRNPVQEIKSIPRIQWKSLIAFQFCLSTFSVVFSNLLAPYAISIRYIFISLVVSLMATGLVSIFFYYFFLIIYEQRFKFIKIFTLVLFAHIPFAIFHLVSYFFPPADLFGLAISAMLMIVGLVENFQTPKKVAMRLMLTLYMVFFIYWSIQLFYSFQYSRTTSEPQNLDRIEQEIQQSLEL